MAARQFVMFCTESAFGTATTSPVLGTDKFYMRLDKDNSFVGTMARAQYPILHGGGLNTEADTAAGPCQAEGTFDFLLFPGVYSALLMKWATTQVNSGGTTPWTVTVSGTQPVGDLGSMSIYRAYVREDGSTYRRELYKGAKCTSWRITANQGPGDSRVFRISGTWVAKSREGNSVDSSSDPTSTPFPAPADTELPTGPYTFGHLATGSAVVTLGTSGGSNRASTCASLTIAGTNKFAPDFFSSNFLTSNMFTGRSVTADIVLRDTASPDDRATWEAQSPITCTLKIDNGTNSLNFAFGTNNLLRPWEIQILHQERFKQRLVIANRILASSGVDITVTAA